MKTISLAALVAVLAMPALAQQAGDWTIGLGVGSVMPKDDNGTVAGNLDVEVGNDARPTLTVEYFVRDNIGIELLAATPFEHDVNIDGVGKVGTVKHLPPTLSVNYHWDTGSAFKPYAGIGLNYTSFWDESTEGALDGNDLDLEHSFGLAVQAGAGIVYDSDPASEQQECVNKAKALFRAAEDAVRFASRSQRGQ